MRKNIMPKFIVLFFVIFSNPLCGFAQGNSNITANITANSTNVSNAGIDSAAGNNVQDNADANNRTKLNANVNSAILQDEKLQKEITKLDNDIKYMWLTPAASLITFTGTMVVIVTFFINYSTTKQTQTDTQFYEALKRFGDADSAALRASATGLLATFAMKKRLAMKAKIMPAGFERPYLKIVINQLLTGLLLEKDAVVLESMNRTLETLIAEDPVWVIDMLNERNKLFQEQLVEELASLCAVKGYAENKPDHLYKKINDELYREASGLSRFEFQTLKDLVEHDEKKYISADGEQIFKREYFKELNRFNGYAEGKRAEYIETVSNKVSVAADNLYHNVALCCSGLKTCLKQGSERSVRLRDKKKLEKIFLAEGDLSVLDLSGLSLSMSLLSNANLTGSILSNTNLSGSLVSGTVLKDAVFKLGTETKSVNDVDLLPHNWWKADFKNADLLLKTFYNLYVRPGSSEAPKEAKSPVTPEINSFPKFYQEMHPSIHGFVKNERRTDWLNLIKNAEHRYYEKSAGDFGEPDLMMSDFDGRIEFNFDVRIPDENGEIIHKKAGESVYLKLETGKKKYLESSNNDGKEPFRIIQSDDIKWLSDKPDVRLVFVNSNGISWMNLTKYRMHLINGEALEFKGKPLTSDILGKLPAEPSANEEPSAGN